MIITQDYKINGVDLIIHQIEFKHLAICRKDKKVFNPTWKQLQKIKNKFFGEDRYAIEIFPSTIDLVDNNNFRHLWCVDKKEIPNLKKWIY